MAFWSEGNHLHLSGRVDGDVRQVSAALHNIVHKQGYQDLTLDFSGATFLAPFTMVSIATMCRAYRRERVVFDLVFPRENKSARLLDNANWAHLIIPERFPDRAGLNVRNLSATLFTTPDQHYKAVDQSIDLFLSSAEGIDRSKLKALEWSLNEITDNVLNHAESPIGGVMQVVNYHTKGFVEFIVGDAGQTIPNLFIPLTHPRSCAIRMA
jgi:hypothetical protein